MPWSPRCLWENIIYDLFSDVHACSLTSIMSDSLRHWTVALQTLLSMGYSRQEHWSGLPFPPPGDRTHSCLRLLHSQQILHPLNRLGSPFCDVAAPFPLNWIYMLGSRRGRCTSLPHSYPAQRLALPDRSCCFICTTIWKHPSWVRIHTHTNTHTIVLSNP